MIERTLLVLALIMVGWTGWRLLTTWQMRRAAAAVSLDPLLASLMPGTATIVYFTTPDCAPCRLQQTPTLLGLQQEMGDRLRVIRVDAAADPDAADRWGVLSVPTTFLLDGRGKPRSVFNGVVEGHRLRQEIEGLSA